MDKGLLKATKQKYQQLVGRLTENTLRLWAVAEAMSLGRGGITLVAGATGLVAYHHSRRYQRTRTALGQRAFWVEHRAFQDPPAWGWAQATDRAATRVAGGVGTFGRSAHPGRPALAAAELSQRFEVHPNQIAQWKGELLERAAEVFGGGQDSACAVDTKALHAKIGQQALEIDFLEHALGRVGVASARR